MSRKGREGPELMCSSQESSCERAADGLAELRAVSDDQISSRGLKFPNVADAPCHPDGGNAVLAGTNDVVGAIADHHRGVRLAQLAQASSDGLSLWLMDFGDGRCTGRDDPSGEPYWEAFRWHSDHVERGRPLDEPPEDPLTVITPDRIVYTEQRLAPRRFQTSTGVAPELGWNVLICARRPSPPSPLMPRKGPSVRARS